MQPKSDDTRQPPLSSETDSPNLDSPEFQRGYRDGYTHESQQSQHPDYLAGYVHGSKDRVLYRDC